MCVSGKASAVAAAQERQTRVCECRPLCVGAQAEGGNRENNSTSFPPETGMTAPCFPVMLEEEECASSVQGLRGLSGCGCVTKATSGNDTGRTAASLGECAVLDQDSWSIAMFSLPPMLMLLRSLSVLLMLLVTGGRREEAL